MSSRGRSKAGAMPKVDLAAIEQVSRTGYPSPFHQPIAGRLHRRLAPPTGLTEMGASHVVLEPGAWSSQRHWHEGEDELVVMLSGSAVLIEDDGETELVPGDIATWAKGVRNGHHIVNRGTERCSFIAISAGKELGGAYSDIDMIFDEEGKYRHRDGTPYEANRA
jgi:uncharacterized cupin superfamily protein